MGGCMNKQVMGKSPSRNSSPNYRSNSKKQTNLINGGDFGIKKHQSQKMLTFIHSPLRYSQFLFDRFNQSNSKPQQVTLGFMINQCLVDIQKKQVFLYVINNNLVKIWFIYGGIQKISDTGLTISINNYKQLQQYRNDKASANKDAGDLIGPIKLCQNPCDNILIILEPSIASQQTIFMIYRYQLNEIQNKYELITQSLQWSSLSFRINDIYGSQYLFKCNDQNQVCSICLTNTSQCILLPCRHMCVCSLCLQKIQKVKPNCPLCRKQYYSVVHYKNG